jgi:hypothetical protein
VTRQPHLPLAYHFASVVVATYPIEELERHNRAEFPDLAKAYGQAAKPETEPDLRGDDPDA